jgi:adenylate cyclase
VAGLDLHLDLGRLVPAERLRVEALREAMAALDAAAGEKGAATS